MSNRVDVERLLTSAAVMVEWPATPDFASLVADSIRAGQQRVGPGRDAPAPWYRRGILDRKRAFAFAAAILAAFAGTLLFSPGARRAVADLIGLGGIVIRSDPSPGQPDLPIPTSAGNVVPGEPSTLDEAHAAVDWELELPGSLVAPDEVYIDVLVPNTAVSLVYLPGPDLPEVNETGVGALLTQFRGRVGEDLIGKIVNFSDEDVRRVEVNGNPGYFIRGVHEVFYTTPSGAIRQDTIRLSGNALIWTHGGITYRLETDLPLREALAIAMSIPERS